MLRPHLRSAVFVLAFFASACSTGPERLDLSGTWQGTTLLPSALSTTVSIVSSGSTFTGSITIEGLLDAPFVGTVNETTRVVTWNVVSGCEQWSGTLDVNVDGTEMSGPVLRDVSACGSGDNATGTITLSK